MIFVRKLLPDIKWNIAWGIFFTLTFFTLLAIRLEFFQHGPEPTAATQQVQANRPSESWMNIYQNKKKIGFVHRTFSSLEKGFYFSEKAFMQITTMNVPQTLNISTEGYLNPDMTISSFNFDLNSSLFRFSANGVVVKNKLILYTGLPNARQKSEILLAAIPHMSGSVYDAAFQADLAKYATRNFNIFDPSSLGMRSIKVTRNADEIIPVMGKRVLTHKYCADFMGAKNCAWLSKEGEVLKETGILGLSLEKVSPDKAKDGTAIQGSVDFTQIASIPSNSKIADPEKLSKIKIKIYGIRNTFLIIHGGRQSFHQNILTIIKEKLPEASEQRKEIPAVLNRYLVPSPLVQSDDPQIKAQVEKIVKPADLPEQKAIKIVNWVYRNISKKPVLSIPNALEVLNNKVGDCNEHAVLTAALLRAAGIPTQIETGLVYQRGNFYYHAWNIAYLGNWITVDSVFNQFPADVTHIRLVRGEGSEQLDLMGVMGKIQLEVLEQIK
jgi:hypothetical protein